MSETMGGSLPDELFSEYRQMMFKIAMGILHNKSDAEDAVRDVFLWIINNLEKFYKYPVTKGTAISLLLYSIELRRSAKAHLPFNKKY